jgi:hypothetical protein
MKKVIISGLNQKDWEFHFIKKITNNYSWKIIYWAVEKNKLSSAKDLFPEAYIVENEKNKKLRYKKFEKYEWPLVDKEILQRMAIHELVLWPSFLRNTQHSGVRGDMSMKDEYHRAITFRYHFMQTFMPDIYFFGNVPTGFYAFLDYIICKEFNIKTIILRRVELPGSFAMPIMSLQQHNVYLKDLTQSFELTKKTTRIKDKRVNQYLLNLNKDYENAMPSQYGKPGGFKGQFKLNEKTGKIQTRKPFLIKLLTEVLQENKSHIKFIMRALMYGFFRKKLQLSFSKLLERELKIDRKYVLVNLHYQPEASSIPMGGIFAYQDLMISMISQAIPKDWYIYVKEHPSHLLNVRMSFSLKFRHESFYQCISQYKNVKLVSVAENNLNLIDNAQAVATLTGTSGFEAINRGIPCFAFGYPWYMYADGCFLINSKKDLSIAINTICAGYKPSKKNLHKFVNLVLDNSIEGMFSRSVDEYDDLETEKQYGEIRAEKFIDIMKKQKVIL